MVKRDKDFGQGIRRLYKDALDERRAVYPMYRELRDINGEVKQSKLTHPLNWYIDGHLVNRPINGIYALARLAEFLLHKVKFGKRFHQGGALRTAMDFYADTRRAMRDVLTSCSIDTKKLPPKLRQRLSKRTGGLIEHAKKVIEACEFMKQRCDCPACKKGRITEPDAELLRNILIERSKVGIIPKTSALYREEPLDIAPGLVI